MSIKKAFIFTFKFLNDRKSIKEKKWIFIGFKSEPLSSLMYHSWIFKSINYVSHFITKMSKCYLSIFQMQYLHYTLGKITGCNIHLLILNIYAIPEIPAEPCSLFVWLTVSGTILILLFLCFLWRFTHATRICMFNVLEMGI